MAELVGDKRKLNCKSIVEKYKILKRTRDIVWCGCKKIRHRKASKIFQPLRPITVNLSMFAENNNGWKRLNLRRLFLDNCINYLIAFVKTCNIYFHGRVASGSASENMVKYRKIREFYQSHFLIFSNASSYKKQNNYFSVDVYNSCLMFVDCFKDEKC